MPWLRQSLCLHNMQRGCEDFSSALVASLAVTPTPGACKIRCHIPRIPHKPLAKWGQNFRYIFLDLDISTPQAISISNPNAPDQSPCAQHLRELKVR